MLFDTIVVDDGISVMFQESRFCLVMPGDGNTAQRLFHALMQGCVPAFFYHADSYPVLPFSAYLKWQEWGLFFEFSSKAEASQAIESSTISGSSRTSKFIVLRSSCSFFF